MYNVVYCTLYYYFNVADVLLSVICQLNFNVLLYVTRISLYITLYIAFGFIRGFT